MTRSIIVVVALMFLFGCATPAQVQGAPTNRLSDSDNPLASTVEHIRLALKGSDKRVRVYYGGNCSQTPKSLFQEVPFPQIELRTPPVGAHIIERLHSIFGAGELVNITEDNNRIVRIRIGDPDLDILDTKIRILLLATDEQYNARLAIDMIDAAPEVVDAAETLGLQQTTRLMLFGLSVVPSEGFPHLPANIENVTMDEALDMIANTFGDIVIFGICSDQYMVRTYDRRVSPED